MLMTSVTQLWELFSNIATFYYLQYFVIYCLQLFQIDIGKKHKLFLIMSDQACRLILILPYGKLCEVNCLATKLRGTWPALFVDDFFTFETLATYILLSPDKELRLCCAVAAVCVCVSFT